MDALIVSLVLSLYFNGNAIFYALFGNVDSIGGMFPLFMGFFGLGPTIFSGVLLITRRKILSKKIKIITVISILSIFLIPLSVKYRDYLNCMGRKSHATNRIDRATKKCKFLVF